VRKAARTVTQLFDEVLQPTGLRSTQFTLLVAVALLGEAPVTKLSEALVMDRTTLARNLKPLESQGLLTLETGTDRRRHLVRLTERGRQALTTALPYWEQAQRRVVTFDFLGWGESSKPAGYAYTAANQMGDVDAVIEQLHLQQVVLVAHDAALVSTSHMRYKRERDRLADTIIQPGILKEIEA
jgi:DNA-binding MarR family transcriptional regulator